MDWVALIREFGFPTVFCLWLMVMHQRREAKIVEVLASLEKVLEQVDNKLDSVQEIQEQQLSGPIPRADSRELLEEKTDR